MPRAERVRGECGRYACQWRVCWDGVRSSLGLGGGRDRDRDQSDRDCECASHSPTPDATLITLVTPQKRQTLGARVRLALCAPSAWRRSELSCDQPASTGSGNRHSHKGVHLYTSIPERPPPPRPSPSPTSIMLDSVSAVCPDHQPVFACLPAFHLSSSVMFNVSGTPPTWFLATVRHPGILGTHRPPLATNWCQIDIIHTPIKQDSIEHVETGE